MNAGQRQRGIGMTSARTRERLVARLREQGISNESVLNQIRNVPRHLFVDEALASRAYEDTALPIGHGQTISQPYVVARMTEAILRDGTPDKVLEIGTGCGYQAAVVAGLVPQVYSIERMKLLADRARARMRELRLNNVKIRHGDGFKGWPGQAPFEAIMVTAAPREVPETLLAQLAEGGRLVIPVGPRGAQALLLVTRKGTEFQSEQLAAVSFVPLLEGLQ